MGIMSIVKSVIEHFRKAGKTEKEISNMIEQAADKATVNKGIAEKKEYKKPEIKAKTTAEQFVEAVMQTGGHSGAGKNGNYENERFTRMHKSPKYE